MKRSLRELENTAYHEAGHAVILWRMGAPISEVTIVPSDEAQSAGHVLSRWWEVGEVGNDCVPDFRCDSCHSPLNPAPILAALVRDDELRTEEETRLLALRYLYAAGEAERLYRSRQRRSAGCSDDDRQASHVAADQWPYYADDTMRSLHRYARLSARDEIGRHWKSVEAVAVALLDRQTLSGEEVAEICRAAKEIPKAKEE